MEIDTEKLVYTRLVETNHQIDELKAESLNITGAIMKNKFLLLKWFLGRNPFNPLFLKHAEIRIQLEEAREYQEVLYQYLGLLFKEQS